jgi:hypothetical protein
VRRLPSDFRQLYAMDEACTTSVAAVCVLCYTSCSRNTRNIASLMMLCFRFPCTAQRAHIIVAPVLCGRWHTACVPTSILLLMLIVKSSGWLQHAFSFFQGDILDQCLGDLYERCDTVIMSPTSFGFPIARNKKYTILRSRTKTFAPTLGLQD